MSVFAWLGWKNSHERGNTGVPHPISTRPADSEHEREQVEFVRRLFIEHIPEIGEGKISIESISRIPGRWTKVAVHNPTIEDPLVVVDRHRETGIKSICEELNGEQLDVVRYSENPEILVANALEPARIDQVLLCDMVGRAIVVLPEDQLSTAIGNDDGENVRLASTLSGWNIELFTECELKDAIERAVFDFCEIRGIDEYIAQSLVEQGFLSYDDLAGIDSEEFTKLSGLRRKAAKSIINAAREMSEEWTS